MTHALQSFWASFVGGFVGAITTDGIRRVRCHRRGGVSLCKFCLLPDGHTGDHEVQRPAAPGCRCYCIECRNAHHDDCPFECIR